ncbi:YrdB family protein [Levilactobacillus tujiorum]|uniref:YrdB family protein n=1 Tax=Levilactobacillus tujiorum TaxID=2912243 RepID=A0ABX1L1S5_9LACO|nr:YrdB family protein [Lactobacillus sp. HBUAS51387]NLR28653.1 YrdB family protein [Levilactobacillus tujiorum]
MPIFFQVNALLRFSVEVVTLVFIILIGLTKYKLPLNLLVGVLVPIVIYMIWSICMAPLSPRRVDLFWRIVIEIAIFGGCTYLLVSKMSLHVGVGYAAIVGVNAIVAHVGDELSGSVH